jgi:hypothetical protein
MSRFGFIVMKVDSADDQKNEGNMLMSKCKCREMSLPRIANELSGAMRARMPPWRAQDENAGTARTANAANDGAQRAAMLNERGNE